MKKVKVLVYMVLKEAIVEVEAEDGLSGHEIVTRALEMADKGKVKLGPTETRFVAFPAE